jgi:hypothetical protein
MDNKLISPILHLIYQMSTADLSFRVDRHHAFTFNFKHVRAFMNLFVLYHGNEKKKLEYCIDCRDMVTRW